MTDIDQSQVGGGDQGGSQWHNLTLTPGLTSVTLGWMVTNDGSRTVELSVRRFGDTDTVFRQLVTHDTMDGDTAYYTVSGLAEDMGYTVCIDSMEATGNDHDNDGECKEFRTLSSSLTAGEQVAAATAVSSSGTAVIVALVCCCCFSRKKRRKEETRDKEKVCLDVNENKTEYKTENHDTRMFHQKCPDLGHGSCWSASCHAPVTSEDTDKTGSDDTCSNDSILYDCIKPPQHHHHQVRTNHKSVFGSHD